jgi:hypothetical protein
LRLLIDFETLSNSFIGIFAQHASFQGYEAAKSHYSRLLSTKGTQKVDAQPFLPTQ